MKNKYYNDTGAGAKYAYSVQTKDTNGNLSSPLYVTVQVPLDCSTNSGNVGSGSCFIATAVFGTPLQKEVMVLRKFRQKYLLNNIVGKIFVHYYYRISPPIAKFISNSELLKSIVRFFLTPIISITSLFLAENFLHNAMVLTFYFLILILPGFFLMYKEKIYVRVILIKSKFIKNAQYA